MGRVAAWKVSVNIANDHPVFGGGFDATQVSTIWDQYKNTPNFINIEIPANITYKAAHSNYFHLTHQFLADMLGVRRSGVTVAAGILQRKQYISYSRGMMSILDRTALKHAACECYQVGIDNYRRLLGEPTPDTATRLLAEQGTP